MLSDVALEKKGRTEEVYSSEESIALSNNFVTPYNNVDELIKGLFNNTGDELDQNFNIKLQQGVSKRILHELSTQGLTEEEIIDYLSNIIAEDITFSIVEPSSLISFGYDWKDGTMISSQGDTLEQMAQRSLEFNRKDSEIFDGLFVMRDAFASNSGITQAILASPQRDPESDSPEELLCLGNFIYFYEYDCQGRRVNAISIEYPSTKEGLFDLLETLNKVSSLPHSLDSSKLGITAPLLYGQNSTITPEKILELMAENLKKYPPIKAGIFERQQLLLQDFERYQQEFQIKKDALAEIFRDYLKQNPQSLEKSIFDLCQTAIPLVRGEYAIDTMKSILLEKRELHQTEVSETTKKQNLNEDLKQKLQEDTQKKELTERNNLNLTARNKENIYRTTELTNHTTLTIPYAVFQKKSLEIEQAKAQTALSQKATLSTENLLQQNTIEKAKITIQTARETSIELKKTQLNPLQTNEAKINTSLTVSAIHQETKKKTSQHKLTEEEKIQLAISKNILTLNNQQQLKLNTIQSINQELPAYAIRTKQNLQKTKLNLDNSLSQSKNSIDNTNHTKIKITSNTREKERIKNNLYSLPKRTLKTEHALTIGLTTEKYSYLTNPTNIRTQNVLINTEKSSINLKESKLTTKDSPVNSSQNRIKILLEENQSLENKKSKKNLLLKKSKKLSEKDKLAKYLAEKKKRKARKSSSLLDIARGQETPKLLIKKSHDKKRKVEEKKRIIAEKEKLIAFLNFLALQLKRKLKLEDWRFNDISAYEIDIFMILSSLGCNADEIPTILDVIRNNQILLNREDNSNFIELIKLIKKAVKLFRQQKSEQAKRKERSNDLYIQDLELKD